MNRRVRPEGSLARAVLSVELRGRIERGVYFVIGD